MSAVIFEKGTLVDGILEPARRVIQAVSGLGNSVSHAVEASHETERLMSLSDEQLASIGLTRETIPQHVMNSVLSRV